MFNTIQIGIMSNTSKDKKHKGSYKRMRELVCEQNRQLIENEINESIEWICPQAGVDKECQLNSKNIMERLGLTDNKFFNGFWPKRAPQWDGMFIATTSKTLYLIEAKSHLSEISSGNKPPVKGDNNYESKKENFKKKKKSLRELMMCFNVDSNKENYWLHTYYQIANRIAFHNKVLEACPNDKIKDVKLVFLNFVDDPDWKKENKHVSEDGWNIKYNSILDKMGITEDQLTEKGIYIWNMDAKLLR